MYSGRNQKNTKVFKRSTGLADQIYNCYTYISKDHTHHEYKVVRETARKKFILVNITKKHYPKSKNQKRVNILRKFI